MENLQLAIAAAIGVMIAVFGVGTGALLRVLNGEIVRLRAACDRERLRADRAVDEIITRSGSGVISEEAVKHRAEEYEKEMRASEGMEEMFAQEIGGEGDEQQEKE